MLESFLLVSSICIDAFVASMAYGTDNIKIPKKSAIIISLIGSLMLGISLLIGNLIKDIVPPNISVFLGFTILMILGFYRFFEGIFKAFIRNGKKNDKPLKFKIFDVNFALQVYADETKADFDKSKLLSIKEALYLSTALSIDSLAVGLGGSLLYINYFETVFLSFVVGLFCIYFGVFIGKKLIEKTDISLSWLSGFILILLAFTKILK